MSCKGMILMGAPGSGKGSQAKKLVELFKIPHISTGDMLRAAIAEGNDLGKKVKATLDTGRLVDDDLINQVVDERFKQSDVKRGFILDGFPRTVVQAEAFEKILDQNSLPHPKVFFLEVSDEALVERLTGRLTCTGCGAVFHRILHPPKVEDVCDFCEHSPLVSRSDDGEATARKRLAVFREETIPLVEFYEQKSQLSRIDGSRALAEISSAIAEALGA